MESRVRGNLHARFGVGENLAITSKDYLSLSIIMAHSSFELINLSREKQLFILEKEIKEITNAIATEKVVQGKNWSLKQMQIFQKNLQYRYDRLFKSEKKDTTINFEELGVDALIVDELCSSAHNSSYAGYIFMRSACRNP